MLLLIAGLLYLAFGNARQALLVMLNVPFALVGGVASLWLRGINLNLSASVGFIALFGIAVLNGVVLIAYTNELRAKGSSIGEAVREAADTRLRPVLMTAGLWRGWDFSQWRSPPARAPKCSDHSQRS